MPRKPPSQPKPKGTPSRIGFCVQDLCHLPVLTEANVTDGIFPCVLTHLATQQVSDYMGPVYGPAPEPRATWSWQEMRDAFPGAIPESHYYEGMIALFTECGE